MVRFTENQINDLAENTSQSSNEFQKDLSLEKAVKQFGAEETLDRLFGYRPHFLISGYRVLPVEIENKFSVGFRISNEDQTQTYQQCISSSECTISKLLLYAIIDDDHQMILINPHEFCFVV